MPFISAFTARPQSPPPSSLFHHLHPPHHKPSQLLPLFPHNNLIIHHPTSVTATILVKPSPPSNTRNLQPNPQPSSPPNTRNLQPPSLASSLHCPCPTKTASRKPQTPRQTQTDPSILPPSPRQTQLSPSIHLRTSMNHHPLRKQKKTIFWVSITKFILNLHTRTQRSYLQLHHRTTTLHSNPASPPSCPTHQPPSQLHLHHLHETSQQPSPSPLRKKQPLIPSRKPPSRKQPSSHLILSQTTLSQTTQQPSHSPRKTTQHISFPITRRTHPSSPSPS